VEVQVESHSATVYTRFLCSHHVPRPPRMSVLTSRPKTTANGLLHNLWSTSTWGCGGQLEVVEGKRVDFAFHHFVSLSTRIMGDYSIQTIKTTAFQDQK
jgi:hypothetical protein